MDYEDDANLDLQMAIGKILHQERHAYCHFVLVAACVGVIRIDDTESF